MSSNKLCPCADFDWSGCDLTLPHHPECPLRTKPLEEPPTADDVIKGASPVFYWRLGHVVPTDDTANDFIKPGTGVQYIRHKNEAGDVTEWKPFNGTIDNVNVSTHSLSSEEVKQAFNTDEQLH